MNPEEKIEKKIQKMSFKAGEDMQKKILEDALKAQLKTKQTDSAATRPNIRRLIMKSPITKFAAAAAIIIIAGLVWFQFLAGTSAYAQVVTELKKAHTVVFTIITQTNQGNGETIKTDVAYKEPGHLRTTTVDGYVAILDATKGKMISIVPQGMYTLAEIKDTGTTDTQGPFASFEAMRNLPVEADQYLGPKEIDGIDAEGYRVTQGDITMTVWIDAKTGDLVQVEQKYASAPGMDKIIKNIKFNVELEDSLFSLTPPAGYQSFGIELKGDISAVTEETFITWLRWWTDINVDETFPPMVAGTEIAKVVMDMGREGKLKESAFGSPEAVMQQMFNALLFVAQLPDSSNWRYTGENVKYGEADTAIFWYRPEGSEYYRVIFGDLHIEEVAPENLPQ